MTLDELKAKWKTVLTDEVISKIRSHAKNLKMVPSVTPSVTLTVVAWRTGDVFLSRFNPFTDDPFEQVLLDQMLPQTTLAIDLALPLMFMLFGNDPQYLPLSGVIDGRGVLFEQPRK
jgi:hypothetical protein